MLSLLIAYCKGVGSTFYDIAKNIYYRHILHYSALNIKEGYYNIKFVHQGRIYEISIPFNQKGIPPEYALENRSSRLIFDSHRGPNNDFFGLTYNAGFFKFPIWKRTPLDEEFSKMNPEDVLT